jgi:hypothetical protein
VRNTHWINFRIRRIKRRIFGCCLLMTLGVLLACGALCGLASLSLYLVHL